MKRSRRRKVEARRAETFAELASEYIEHHASNKRIGHEDVRNLHGSPHKKRTGKRPQVFLASLGELAVHSERSMWVRNFLAAGGIEAIGGPPLHNSADAGKAFADSGAAIACIASSDQVYAELAEATAGALKAAGATRVLLAGRPKAQEAALKSAGVDTFIFAGCDAVATLTSLHEALGVKG